MNINEWVKIHNMEYEKNLQLDHKLIGPRAWCQYCKNKKVLSPCYVCQQVKRVLNFCCRLCGEKIHCKHKPPIVLLCSRKEEQAKRLRKRLGLE